jgi:hypothetical protein
MSGEQAARLLLPLHGHGLLAPRKSVVGHDISDRGNLWQYMPLKLYMQETGCMSKVRPNTQNASMLAQTQSNPFNHTQQSSTTPISCSTGSPPHQPYLTPIHTRTRRSRPRTRAIHALTGPQSRRPKTPTVPTNTTTSLAATRRAPCPFGIEELLPFS